MPYKEYLNQAVRELEVANLLFEKKILSRVSF